MARKVHRRDFSAQTNNISTKLEVLPLDEMIVGKSVSIYESLKKENKLIGSFDILIAATAIAYDVPLATLNRKHFERIDGLKLIDIERDQP